MSQVGNEPALLDPKDQPVVVAATPDAQPAAPAADEVLDIDLKELRDAVAAVKAEETAGTGTGEPKVEGALAAAAAAQPIDQKPAGQQKPDVVMIPKPRLDEALTAASQAKEQAAYWRGVAEARAQPVAGQPGHTLPQAAQQTPEQRLAEVHGQIDALAKKFDDGEISMADFKKQERTLQAQEQAIQQEGKPASQQQAQDGDALYLDTLTAQLETAHPWVAVFDAVGTNADWNYLKGQAVENLTQRGIDPTKGTVGHYELRKEIATLADQLGPALLTTRAQAKGIALPGQPSPQPQQQQQHQQLSPEAKARLAKLSTQQGAAPDITALSGTPGAHPNAVSEANIESMNEDDIAKLPAAVRNKLLGLG